MLTKIVAVHEDWHFLDLLLSKLDAEGYVATGFNDGLTAFNALNNRQHVDVLVTGITLVSGRPHGLALASVAGSYRPLLRVIYVGKPELGSLVEQGTGCLLPADPDVIVQAVAAETGHLTPLHKPRYRARATSIHKSREAAVSDSNNSRV